ncbi:response regulator transcription factor [Aeribacillus sp. FSL K6-2848]|uniref:response regulator transcription factor n=1 Tax=Bacillales TaxID=1385 RepID=UPI0030C9D078
MPAKVLVVEDDKEINELVCKCLKSERYIVRNVLDGNSALEEIRTEVFDLIILDLMLPEVDGFEIINYIREQENYTPILILSAKNEEVDKILSLGLGADDYISKPFSIAEFLARVKAHIRRNSYFKKQFLHSDVKIIRFKDLELDLNQHILIKNGKQITLTPKEFEILKYFIENQNKVIKKRELYEEIWKEPYFDDNTVMVHIRKLREKIEDGTEQTYIQTVWGIGYKMEGEQNE